jgi:putative membrane protein
MEPRAEPNGPEDRAERGSMTASRRTRLAGERTALAWLRSGLAALAVAIGVGRLLPEVGAGPRWALVLLGIGYAVLGAALIVVGLLRQRALDRALARGDAVPRSERTFAALGGYAVVLAVATVAIILM